MEHIHVSVKDKCHVESGLMEAEPVDGVYHFVQLPVVSVFDRTFEILNDQEIINTEGFFVRDRATKEVCTMLIEEDTINAELPVPGVWTSATEPLKPCEPPPTFDIASLPLPVEYGPLGSMQLEIPPEVIERLRKRYRELMEQYRPLPFEFGYYNGVIGSLK